MRARLFLTPMASHVSNGPISCMKPAFMASSMLTMSGALSIKRFAEYPSVAAVTFQNNALEVVGLVLLLYLGGALVLGLLLAQLAHEPVQVSHERGPVLLGEELRHHRVRVGREHLGVVLRVVGDDDCVVALGSLAAACVRRLDELDDLVTRATAALNNARNQPRRVAVTK